MSCKRFWHTGEITSDWVALDKEELSHAKVARIRQGEELELMDGMGFYWRGVFQTNGVRIIERGTVPLPQPELTLAVGLTQGGTFETIVNQAVQMGATEIIPLKTEHGGAALDDKRMGSKRERWEKICIEACKQSGNYWKPALHSVIDFGDALGTNKDALNLVAALEGTTTPWKELEPNKNKIVLWIGPEGDFSKKEYEAFKKANVKFVSLGPTVLRVETACVAGLALTKLLLG